MKKTIIAIGAALSMSGILAGCGAGNAATDHIHMRDVGYYKNNSLNYKDARLQDVRNPRHADQFNQSVGRDNNNVPPYTEPLSFNNADNALARKIAARVDQIKGVKSSQAIVTRQQVIVGANVTNKAADTPKLHRQIKSAVKPYAAGRNIRITTDRRFVGRITKISGQLNAGKTWNEVQSDVKGISNDLAKAAKRPFQNNAK